MKTGFVYGIDLGSTCGIARARIAGGQVADFRARSIQLCPKVRLSKFSKDQLRGQDPRVVEFAKTLQIELGDAPAEQTLVVFEDVRFAKSLAQVQLWSSFRGALWSQFGRYGWVAAVATGTLKRYATGCGDAEKPDMRAAALRVWGATVIATWDDNAVDAAWLARYGVEQMFPNL